MNQTHQAIINGALEAFHDDLLSNDLSGATPVERELHVATEEAALRHQAAHMRLLRAAGLPFGELERLSGQPRAAATQRHAGEQ